MSLLLGTGGSRYPFLLYGTFTTANGGLNGHVPDYNIAGDSWTTIGNTTANIASSAAQLGDSQPDIVTVGVGSAEHRIKVTWNQGNSNRLGIINRFASTGSYVFVEASGDAGAQLQLRYYNGAFNTTASTAVTWSDPTTMVIVSKGSTITAAIEGTTITISGVVTEAQAASSIGLWGWAAGTASFDTIEVTRA